MFGLFDRPPKNIRKRIPAEADLTMDSIETLIDVKTEGWNKNKRDILAGMILSVWATNCNTHGVFLLKDWDVKYIYNLGNNCANMLDPHEQELGKEILDQLIENKIIPKAA